MKVACPMNLSSQFSFFYSCRSLRCLSIFSKGCFYSRLVFYLVISYSTIPGSALMLGRQMAVKILKSTLLFVLFVRFGLKGMPGLIAIFSAAFFQAAFSIYLSSFLRMISALIGSFFTLPDVTVIIDSFATSRLIWYFFMSLSSSISISLSELYSILGESQPFGYSSIKSRRDRSQSRSVEPN